MLTPEIRFLLTFSKVELSKSELSIFSDYSAKTINWQQVAHLAVYHRVAPLLYYNIKKIDLPEKIVPGNIVSLLEKHYFSNLSRNLRLWNEFIFIYDNLRNKGIELIPIKGIIFSRISYPDPALRPIAADIDIIIKEKDIKSAIELLGAIGYHIENNPEDAGHAVTLVKEAGICLELHWRLLPPLIDKFNLNNLWQRSYLRLIDNKLIRVLSDEDTLLILPLQVHHDWLLIRLSRLCDINEIVSRQTSHLDWDYLLAEARACNTYICLLFCLYLCHKLLFTPLPEKVLIIIKRSVRIRLLEIFSRGDIQKILNAELKFRRRKRKNWFLKGLLTDSPLDLLKIARYKIELYSFNNN
jgi:hypothetical protein